MNTTTDTVKGLASAALGAAFRGANEYLAKHNLTAEPDALAACVKAHVKANVQSAFHDASEALACGMEQAAIATFQASMVLAGIEGAKEASGNCAALCRLAVQS